MSMNNKDQISSLPKNIFFQQLFNTYAINGNVDSISKMLRLTKDSSDEHMKIALKMPNIHPNCKLLIERFIKAKNAQQT